MNALTIGFVLSSMTLIGGAAVLSQVKELPPDEQHAKAFLDKSPRHGEYVDVTMPDGKTKINTWVVYPERKDKAPVVLVIHEIFGLSDWIRAVGDALAQEGYIAVVPDLISGMGPGGGGTESAKDRDAVVKLVSGMAPAETIARLNAVRDYAVHLPSADGKCATVGFCWGGTNSFLYATAQPDLQAAVVYYGTSPDSVLLSRIKVPVLGNYGGDDARVDATVEPAAAVMKELGKPFEYEMYEGAGHGFLRQQTGRDGANMRATEKAWPKTLAFLRKYL